MSKRAQYPRDTSDSIESLDALGASDLRLPAKSRLVGTLHTPFFRTLLGVYGTTQRHGCAEGNRTVPERILVSVAWPYANGSHKQFRLANDKGNILWFRPTDSS